MQKFQFLGTILDGNKAIDLDHFPVGTKIYAEVPQKKYDLPLTDAEARTLKSVLYSCGGDPKTTARAHIDTILSKLGLLGVKLHPQHENDLEDGFADKSRECRGVLYIKANAL